MYRVVRRRVRRRMVESVEVLRLPSIHINNRVACTDPRTWDLSRVSDHTGGQGSYGLWL